MDLPEATNGLIFFFSLQARLVRLRPNTEYQVLLQAANDFGAGPAEATTVTTMGDGEREREREERRKLKKKKKFFYVVTLVTFKVSSGHFAFPFFSPPALQCPAPLPAA